jgi:hypothetical protein
MKAVSWVGKMAEYRWKRSEFKETKVLLIFPQEANASAEGLAAARPGRPQHHTPGI